jgi:hypothetical protein
MAELGAFFGNPNLQRQGAKARELAKRRDVNTLPDPLTYAVMQGLLGTRPDEMGFSVLNPDYEKIKKVAEPAFALGLLGQAAPALAPLTKGLPVGASIKNVGDDLLSYRGTHTAPNAKRYGATLDDLTKILPDDVYSQEGKRLYGYGDRLIDSEWRTAALKTRGKPNAEIEIFRAVPKGVKEINDGDWVSTSKAYAKTHGESTLNGEYDIISKKVKAKTLSTEGYPYEYGYNEVPNFPRQEALDTAQRNAALPVEEGGLGLPKDNTPEMRAEAMGGIDAVHFSRKGGDYTELDSGKFAIAPFDAVGTHVGTPQAAMERFQNTVGYKVNNPNYALDELTGSSYPVKVLGDKPLLNQNGMPWGEDDLNTFLRQTGGHNYSDINGGKLTYQDLNADLRKKLFDEQGYTSIPYFNEVEGKGSVSYIVPPKNLRSQFAAFDPMRKNETDILAGVLPLGLLADEEKRKEIQSLLE